MTVYDLSGARPRRAAAHGTRARSARREREVRAAEALVADLKALVDAGLVVPVTGDDRQRRYAPAPEQEPWDGGGRAPGSGVRGDRARGDGGTARRRTPKRGDTDSGPGRDAA